MYNINTAPQSPSPPSLSPAARLHCPSLLPSQGHLLHTRLKPPSSLRLAPCARVYCRTATPARAVSRARARGWGIAAAAAAAGDLSGPRFPGEMKYVLVTGGVVSGLGKGVTASSIGVVLKSCGLRITSIKIGTCRPRRRLLQYTLSYPTVKKAALGARKGRALGASALYGLDHGGSDSSIRSGLTGRRKI